MFQNYFEFCPAEYWDENKEVTKQVNVCVNFPPTNWTFRDTGFNPEFFLFTDDGDIYTIQAYHCLENYDLFKKKIIVGMCLGQIKPGIDFLIHGDYFGFPDEAESIHPVSRDGSWLFTFEWMGEAFEAIIDNDWGYSTVQLAYERFRNQPTEPIPLTWWEWYNFENLETWTEYVQNRNLMFYEI